MGETGEVNENPVPSKPAQIASLTPLRGIAAILVVLFHLTGLAYMQHLGEALPGTSILSRGYLWVDFFFVLSGFIITHVYGDRFTNGLNRREVKNFLVARFARLYPLHFVALCMTIALYLLVYAKMPPSKADDGFNMADFYGWKALPFHFLWLIGFGLTKMSWNVPAWSISTEWWTYVLTLPLFRYLNRGVSKRTFIVPALCILALYVLVSHHESNSLDITFDFGILRCLLSFTLGICLYQFYKTGVGRSLLSSDRALLCALLLTLLILHFPYPAGTPAPPPLLFRVHPFTPYFDVASPLVFALLALCVAYNHGKGYQFLNIRPLRYLGDISFSVYLMQGNSFTVFMIAAGSWRQKHPVGDMGWSDKLLLYSFVVLFDVVLAMATYRWVERPARGWIRRKLSAEKT